MFGDFAIWPSSVGSKPEFHTGPDLTRRTGGNSFFSPHPPRFVEEVPSCTSGQAPLRELDGASNLGGKGIALLSFPMWSLAGFLPTCIAAQSVSDIGWRTDLSDITAGGVRDLERRERNVETIDSIDAASGSSDHQRPSRKTRRRLEGGISLVRSAAHVRHPPIPIYRPPPVRWLNSAGMLQKLGALWEAVLSRHGSRNNVIEDGRARAAECRCRGHAHVLQGLLSASCCVVHEPITPVLGSGRKESLTSTPATRGLAAHVEGDEEACIGFGFGHRSLTLDSRVGLVEILLWLALATAAARGRGEELVGQH